MCYHEGQEREIDILDGPFSTLHISLGSTLQCCSEMWELLQTETNGDSCPGREKICIESRQSFGSDIKNIPRRERAVHCSLHAAPAGCSLDSAVIHTAGIIVLCRLSQPSHKAAKMWMNSLELIDFVLFSKNTQGFLNLNCQKYSKIFHLCTVTFPQCSRIF